MRDNHKAQTSQKYPNPKLGFSVQTAMLDRPSDEGFLKAMSHMSLKRDPCDPVAAPKPYIQSRAPDDELYEKLKKREKLATHLEVGLDAIKRADEDNILRSSSFVLPSE